MQKKQEKQKNQNQNSIFLTEFLPLFLSLLNVDTT